MVSRRVSLLAETCTLSGELSRPERAEGIVLIAQGGTRGRGGARHRFIAAQLHQRRMATLLLDMLTCTEESLDARSGTFRFDCALLSDRLESAVEWIGQQPTLSDLPIGLFAAGTGAAAALMAAAARPDLVRAIVSEGGRPDLAPEALKVVFCPTLFLVGEADCGILELNQAAFGRVSASEKKLEVVAGATRLDEEPETFTPVSERVVDWFTAYLGGARAEPLRHEAGTALPLG